MSTTTRLTQHVEAPRADVFRALTLPPGVSAADNETGWRMSLGKLARLVEAEVLAKTR